MRIKREAKIAGTDNDNNNNNNNNNNSSINNSIRHRLHYRTYRLNDFRK